MNDDVILSVENLGKSFDLFHLERRLRACDGISFKVDRGSFVSITGRSGSGKSTILKMIYRTYVPDTGVILYASERFGAVDMGTITERAVLYLRKHEIGYVSQFLNVIPRTTARELVKLAVLELGIDEETADAEARRMLEHFELDRDLWDSFPATFSGGEKLRLNIARAMVKHPRLLLLDEPTASLDDHSKSRVRDILLRLKSEGTTMLGIFHDLQFIKGFCDHEYNMQAGSFVTNAH